MGQIFDFLPSRTKVNVAAYFEQMHDKNRVEVIVADMWRGYHALADKYFPGRLVVVDKFHVIRMARNGLDEVGKAVGRSRSAEQRKQLRDVRFLLAKRRQNLTDEERIRVDIWLRAFPILRKAYDTKERFTDAYDAPNRILGERAIGTCLQFIPVELDPFFRDLTTAVTNWKDRICNSFENRRQTPTQRA